jgi:hypothetical protein
VKILLNVIYNLLNLHCTIWSLKYIASLLTFWIFWVENHLKGKIPLFFIENYKFGRAWTTQWEDLRNCSIPYQWFIFYLLFIACHDVLCTMLWHCRIKVELETVLALGTWFVLLFIRSTSLIILSDGLLTQWLRRAE